MPEGDTIFRTAEVLRAALVGRRVIQARAQARPGMRRIPDLSRLIGTAVASVESRGKHLLIGFENGLTLRSHLRMTGSWHRYRPGESWRLPQQRASAIIETAEAVAVAFDTPVVELLTDADLRRSPALTALGPDLLGAEFDLQEALRRLRERDGEDLGTALLDQHAVAGIGNAYKSEVAFLERLDPWAPVARSRTKSWRGPAHRPPPAPGQHSWRRTGHDGERAAARAVGLRPRGPAMPPCGTLILQRRQGELARQTFWCPRCQPPAMPGEGYASIRLILAPIATSFASICS